jgi:hypothetical protein
MKATGDQWTADELLVLLVLLLREEREGRGGELREESKEKEAKTKNREKELTRLLGWSHFHCCHCWSLN